MISFLGSEIGRGHPFYLDGVERALRAKGRADLIARRSDVFSVSRGTSLLAWRAVRAAYEIGGRGGLASAVYQRFRRHTDYERPSAVLRALGRDLRRWAADGDVIVVDHPAVCGALGGRADVWYAHGEMIAPPEAIVRRAARVFVPLPETAAAFVHAGVPKERLLVTGICVENELVPLAAAAFEARRERLVGAAPLTVAFFSSGSEPGPHVRALAAGACALSSSGRHRAVVFAKARGRLYAAVHREAARVTRGPEVVPFDGREDLDRRTAQALPEIDLVASPPHERSNWAVALGLPFLLVGPDLGPFAPRNRALLLGRGVATEIVSEVDALMLPARIDRLRSEGALLEMSQRGWGPDFRGFERAAAFLEAETGARRESSSVLPVSG